MIEEIIENCVSKEMQSDKCVFISTLASDFKDTQFVVDAFRLVSI